MASVKRFVDVLVHNADTVPLDVSQHAVSRYAERFASAYPELLESEIREHLRAGRVSTRRPHWVWYLDNTDECLYVWTEDMRRVFVLTPNRYDNGTSFAVTTVLKLRHSA